MEKMTNQNLVAQTLLQTTKQQYECTRFQFVHFFSYVQNIITYYIRIMFKKEVYVCHCQQSLAGISHISFAEEESITPKKPTTLPEVAKQRELSGTLQSEEAKLKKQLSDAKSKELGGHDIFAPPPEIVPRPTTVRALALKDNFDMGEPDTHKPAGGSTPSEETVVKTAKKIHNQKFAELSGNDIFKGDVPPGSAEKPLSVAKLREMSGSNIFAEGKVESRVSSGRKPPGGESTIALV
ncbi:hypothetical protein V6Z11_D06G041800 [Gossypium hirsutum]